MRYAAVTTTGIGAAEGESAASIMRSVSGSGGSGRLHVMER